MARFEQCLVELREEVRKAVSPSKEKLLKLLCSNFRSGKGDQIRIVYESDPDTELKKVKKGV